MSYSISLEHEEVELVVDALRIQRERWQDALMKKMANDPSMTHRTLDSIQEILSQHDALLKRLPNHGLSR